MSNSFAEMKRWGWNTTFGQSRDGGCYKSEMTWPGSTKIGTYVYGHHTNIYREYCYSEMNRWKWNKQNNNVALSSHNAFLCIIVYFSHKYITPGKAYIPISDTPGCKVAGNRCNWNISLELSFKLFYFTLSMHTILIAITQ